MARFWNNFRIFVPLKSFAVQTFIWSVKFLIHHKSRARHHYSFKLGSELKYLKSTLPLTFVDCLWFHIVSSKIIKVFLYSLKAFSWCFLDAFLKLFLYNFDKFNSKEFGVCFEYIKFCHWTFRQKSSII